MTNKQFGLLGIAIPLLFLTGMIIYYTLFNISMFFGINEHPLMLYCLPKFEGAGWMSNFNHIFIGILMVAFIIFMLRKTDNSFSNTIGKSLLLISSLSWIAFGLIPFYTENEDKFIDIGMGLSVSVLGCAAIGFIALSAEFEKISRSRLFKKILAICGILIILDTIANTIFGLVFEVYSYFNGISKLVWLVYFGGFGILGYAIATKPAEK